MRDTNLGKLKHFSRFVSGIFPHVVSTEPITQRKKEGCPGTKGPYATMEEGDTKEVRTVKSHNTYTGFLGTLNRLTYQQTNSNGHFGIRLSLFLYYLFDGDLDTFHDSQEAN